MRSNRGFLLRLAAGFLSVGSLAVVPQWAMAQGPRPSVTLQLPEFHYFGTSGSVLVPDRGTVYLGGIGRSSSGQTTSGSPLIPFANRGSGRSGGAASTSVSAWVHDFKAMDEAVLAEAHRRNDGKEGLRYLEKPFDDDPTPDNTLVSAEEHARRQAVEQDEVQAAARRHFKKAQLLLAAGKPGVARIYFQMALRRAKGPLKAEIAAALAASRGSQLAAEAK
jgi:hypothetical protein